MEQVIHDFCDTQVSLLEAELHAEGDNDPNEEENDKSSSPSNRLSKLTVAKMGVGLYGRTVVTLERAPSALLPTHRFTTGDPVQVQELSSSSSSNNNKSHQGVISQVTEHSVSVALQPNRHNDNDDDLSSSNSQQLYCLLSVSNVQVHQKLVANLQVLKKLSDQSLVRALFERATPKNNNETTAHFHPINHTLNASQQETVQFCLSSPLPVSLIHGPPGTGKTTTVVELLRQLLAQNKTVLVTAPSNVAVDTILLKLVETQAKKRLRAVRLGHPARLQPKILPYSLEHLVQNHEGTEIVKDVRNELQSHLQLLSSKKGRAVDKRLIYRELKTLRKEIRTREETVVRQLLDHAQLVFATCVGAAHPLIQRQTFDVVIIDEAAQALEAASWIPILKATQKIVLAGDHNQLPPTIMSKQESVNRQLSKTLFERIMELYGDKDNATTTNGTVSRMLQTQYRMNQTIADWASQALYHSQLLTPPSVQNRILSDLEGVDAIDTENVSDSVAAIPLLLIDTAGCGYQEEENAAGSRLNQGEAQLVAQHVIKLLELGVKQDEIAVITPYSAQVEILRLSLLPNYPKLQIRSVDGFQGGEREAVVLSLVRSRGRNSSIGFLRDNRRLNVAVTRAKRHLCVICDTDTVCQSPFIRNLIDWMEEHGEHRSALELLDDIGIVESDMALAEKELQRLMASVPVAKPSKRKDPKKTRATEGEIEEKRVALEKRVAEFQATSQPGQEMVFSSELSKLDRKLVHEIAEKVGLLHISSGTDGVDRCITLSIPETKELLTLEKEADSKPSQAANHVVQREEADEEPIRTADGTISSFAALLDDEEAGESTTDDEPPDGESCDGKASETNKEDCDKAKGPDIASTVDMKALANERALREKQKCKQEAERLANPKTKPKKRRKKLGGNKKGKPKVRNDNDLDDLDDMAFLDAQIETVQNSHGVKLEASGKNYRTIVNGILLSKPKPPEKKQNVRASNALQQKLNKAKAERSAKPKKK